ncbi:hypothetical protein CMV_024388 [Castanea mollissima]|uniref:Uncharacterized protein n=1 Tax=Castanea mollissima TaxID=60419 RepID=A0A8J4VI11_9ROSI|nr:hypothetical protein CMV_024388 [Castanea mollissima]
MLQGQSGRLPNMLEIIIPGVKGKFLTSENGYFGYFVGVQETKTIEMMSSINGYAFINIWRNFCFSNILFYWDGVDFQHGCKSWESH